MIVNRPSPHRAAAGLIPCLHIRRESNRLPLYLATLAHIAQLFPMTDTTSATAPVALDNATYRAAVAVGLADVAAGRTIPYEDVRNWLLTWGTPDELPPPQCTSS